MLIDIPQGTDDNGADDDHPMRPETWREQATYTVPDFVKMIMEEYRAFEVVSNSFAILDK